VQLDTRSLPSEIPKYSLTGDILSFQRCGLQYRYYNGSSLPPSRPVQLWTGEFVHGMLEEAYLYWQRHKTPFPWPCTPTPIPPPDSPQNREDYDLGVLGDRVEARLRAAGKVPRNKEARESAYNRVEAALRILAPHLFPLITATEERIRGTRDMPLLAGGRKARGDRYELTGVVDVISHVSLIRHQENPLVDMIVNSVSGLKGSFDIIVDYKAARRPPIIPEQGRNRYWDYESWQVQTYAWLRKQQPGANPVGAGVLIYVNELSPSQTDLVELLRELQQDRTDVRPINGSADYYALYRWRQGDPVPVFTNDFLLKRAIRIVPVTVNDINRAVSAIDEVVSQIETCALNENTSGKISTNWPMSGDEQDCDACDFRRFCTSPARVRRMASRGVGIPVKPPGAPG